ncbi:MAG: hypothetical protein V4507_04780 [Verrucomicrobiota bacterium]
MQDPSRKKEGQKEQLKVISRRDLFSICKACPSGDEKWSAAGSAAWIRGGFEGRGRKDKKHPPSPLPLSQRRSIF